VREKPFTVMLRERATSVNFVALRNTLGENVSFWTNFPRIAYTKSGDTRLSHGQKQDEVRSSRASPALEQNPNRLASPCTQSTMMGSGQPPTALVEETGSGSLAEDAVACR